MTRSNKTTKYILYARKSSESEDRQVQSIDDQITRLKQLAAELGLKVVKTYTEARSAKSPNDRPLFTAMIESVECGEAQGILCWQINRLSRNPVDSGTIGWLLQRGVLHCIRTIEREYLPEDNVLLYSLETGMANQYILDLSKNVKRGIQGKLERGEIPGPAPCGYLNDLRDHKAIKDPERFDHIQKAWRMLLTGNHSVGKIWNWLTYDAKFTTLRRRRVGGTPIAKSTLFTMFCNPFYAGIIVCKGKEYAGIHEPMITLEEYDKAQKILGRKKRPALTKRHFAFTRLIKCGECGCYVIADQRTKSINKRGDMKTYVYYHCTLHSSKIRCSQTAYISEKNLVDQVAAYLQQYTILPVFFEWAADCLRDKRDEATSIERLRVCEADIKVIEAQIANLNQMRYKDFLTDEEYLRDKKTLSNELVEANVKLAQSHPTGQSKIDRLIEDFDIAAHAYTKLQTSDADKKNEILSKLGSNLLLTGRTLTFRPFPPFKIIGEVYPPLERKYVRLEPTRNGLSKTKKDAIASIKKEWLGVVDMLLNLPDSEWEAD